MRKRIFPNVIKKDAHLIVNEVDYCTTPHSPSVHYEMLKEEQVLRFNFLKVKIRFGIKKLG